MKLEVGMYVRTKDGAIAKIEQIVDDEIHFNIKPIFSDGEQFGYNWFYIKDVIKSRHNIIDLIEVGDYVNGEKVGEVIKKEMYHFGDGIIIKNEDDKDIYSNFRYSKYEDIKTIVTKEQFESMSYKVEVK